PFGQRIPPVLVGDCRGGRRDRIRSICLRKRRLLSSKILSCARRSRVSAATSVRECAARTGGGPFKCTDIRPQAHMVTSQPSEARHGMSRGKQEPLLIFGLARTSVRR